MNIKRLVTRNEFGQRVSYRTFGRLLSVLMLLFVVQFFVVQKANAQDKKVTLRVVNVPLSNVLNNLSKQTHYKFFYSDNNIDTNQKVTLNVVNRPLNEVLTELFKEKEIGFQLKNNQILLFRKSTPSNTDSVTPQAQESNVKKISGKVTDEKGQSLPGVTIMVQGTTKGTISDANGNYSLQNVAPNQTLEFSFVGMQKDLALVGNRAVINVTMTESATGLNEVVVVGYGTQKKVDVIGSIAQVGGEQIESRPITNLSNGLTGNLAGVTVIESSGKPGADASTVSVRGVGSFGATPSALILVDGIPGTMNEINPDDIESISVLKDASSAAIYGARAANGVILITTKKGKEGQTHIRYDGYFGWQAATEFPQLANSWDYATLFNVANGGTGYTSEQIAGYKAGNDPDNYPNTNFLKSVFSRNGPITAHDLSITGGTDKAMYFISFGYLNQQGLVERNYYERYNARVNLKINLYQNLSLSVNLSGSKENRNEPQPNGTVDMGTLEGIVDYAVRYPAVFVGQYSDGTYGAGFSQYGTPIAWLASKSYLRSPSSKFNSNSKIDWKPIPGLTLSGIVGYNNYVDDVASYRASQILSPTLILPTSFLDQSRNETTYKTVQAISDYSKKLGDHNIGLLLGYSFEQQITDYFNGHRESFASNDYTVMSMGGSLNQQVAGYYEEWDLQSYFGRFTYNYKERYLFESTVRYDGSSRFPPGRKFGTFPSLAAGWRVSEEPFFQRFTNVVSNLKLKASWGILGNQNISNYPYQSTLTSGLNYPIGGNLATGAGQTVLTDPTIHWESTRTTDGGIEISLWKGLFDLEATYFNKDTYDILYQPAASVSAVLGMSLSQMNIGSLKNSGFEFQLTHKKTFGDFNYKLTGILSIINNKVTSLGIGGVAQPNGMIGNGSNLFVGYPMQMYYGYKTDGVFLNNNEVASWPDQTKINPSSQAGDFRYVDINHDGVVDTKDQTYLGSSIPKFNYSANLELGYKGFDFNALLQGVAGVSGLLNGYVGYAFYNLGTIQKWQIDGHFDPNNPVRYPGYPRLQFFSNTTPPNYVTSDFWVLNASYLRLKNIQLGYTFPARMLKNTGLEKVRIYFSGDNLLTFNHYRPGWDPEINTEGHYYPILATYTFGVNIGF